MTKEELKIELDNWKQHPVTKLLFAHIKKWEIEGNTNTIVHTISNMDIRILCNLAGRVCCSRYITNITEEDLIKEVENDK